MGSDRTLCWEKETKVMGRLKLIRHYFWQWSLMPKAYNFIKKETLAQVLSYEFCEISQNTFLTEHLRTTASVIYVVYQTSFKLPRISIRVHVCFIFDFLLTKTSQTPERNNKIFNQVITPTQVLSGEFSKTYQYSHSVKYE